MHYHKFYFSLFVLLLLACSGKKTENNIDEYKKVIPDSQSLSYSQKRTFSIDTIAFLEENRKSGDYWPASTNKLKSHDLAFIPPTELRIIRNEIFARKGYIFKSKDLKKYFTNKKWYIPLFEDVDHLLTSLEIDNIKLILQEESRNKELSIEEQLDIFISYQDSGKSHTPEMLSFKYGESCLDCFRSSFQKHFIRSIFSDSKNKHLVYESYLLCDQCDYKYSIVTYSADGKILNNIELGSGIFELVTDTSFIFINITNTVSEAYKDSIGILQTFELEYDQDSVSNKYILDSYLIKRID
jgi:hypothetical protein